MRHPPSLPVSSFRIKAKPRTSTTTWNRQYRYKSLVKKPKKNNPTSAFWCLLSSFRSTDLLTEKAHLAFHHGEGTLEGDQRRAQKMDLQAAQLPDQAPAMTKNEKPEKPMES